MKWILCCIQLFHTLWAIWFHWPKPYHYLKCTRSVVISSYLEKKKRESWNQTMELSTSTTNIKLHLQVIHDVQLFAARKTARSTPPRDFGTYCHNFFPAVPLCPNIYMSSSKQSFKTWKGNLSMSQLSYKHYVPHHWVPMLLNFRTRCLKSNQQNFFPYCLSIQAYEWLFFSVNKLVHKYSLNIR